MLSPEILVWNEYQNTNDQYARAYWNTYVACIDEDVNPEHPTTEVLIAAGAREHARMYGFFDAAVRGVAAMTGLSTDAAYEYVDEIKDFTRIEREPIIRTRDWRFLHADGTPAKSAD